MIGILDNEGRSERASEVINCYAQIDGVDEDFALRDMLADLMHYCVSCRIDFKHELDMAEINFDAEVEEEESNGS